MTISHREGSKGRRLMKGRRRKDDLRLMQVSSGSRHERSPPWKRIRGILINITIMNWHDTILARNGVIASQIETQIWQCETRQRRWSPLSSATESYTKISTDGTFWNQIWMRCQLTWRGRDFMGWVLQCNCKLIARFFSCIYAINFLNWQKG